MVVTARRLGVRTSEMRVLLLLAVGHTRFEIAERLKTTSATISTHRHRAMKLLGLRNDAELARHALREGWVSL
jgi:DNA-binding NarL/FixJ family response regulator